MGDRDFQARLMAALDEAGKVRIIEVPCDCPLGPCGWAHWTREVIVDGD